LCFNDYIGSSRTFLTLVTLLCLSAALLIKLGARYMVTQGHMCRPEEVLSQVSIF